MAQINETGLVDLTGEKLQVKDRAGTVWDYDLKEVAESPLPEYYLIKDLVHNARRERYFERVLFDVAAVIPGNLDYRIWDRGANSGLGAIYANTGNATGDPMSPWHTNLTGRGGEFPRDNVVIIHEIDVRLRIANTRGTYTRGILTNPTVAVETNFSATALFDMLTENLHLRFWRGDQPMEGGFLAEWFASSGQTGTFGGDANEGWVQNATPAPFGNKMLDRVKVFNKGDGGFHGRLTNPTGKDLTLPADMGFHINCGMRSRVIAPFYR